MKYESKTKKLEKRVEALEKRLTALEEKSKEKFISETTTKAAEAAETLFAEYLYGSKKQ